MLIFIVTDFIPIILCLWFYCLKILVIAIMVIIGFIIIVVGAASAVHLVICYISESISLRSHKSQCIFSLSFICTCNVKLPEEFVTPTFL